MKELLFTILKSKKFLYAVGTAIVALAAKKGLDLDTEFVMGILGLGATLILGQGAADFGKEAKKVEGTNSTKAGLLLLLLLPASMLTGCQCTAERDALARVGDVIPRVANDIHPTDGGGEARKAELLKLAEECRRLGEVK